MLCDVIFTLLFSYTMYYVQRYSMRSKNNYLAFTNKNTHRSDRWVLL